MNDNKSSGIFVLTNDSLIAPVTNWPTNYGAPSELNGQPLLLGDMMAWGLFTAHAPDPSVPLYHDALFQDPIAGLDLGISVYMFDDSEVENLLFVRYDVINNTSDTISDLHVGYHSDTDLTARTGNTGCNIGNATGYDATLALSYTYNTQSKTGDLAPDYCFGVLSGFMFLQSPLNGLSRDQVLAHTIIRKNTDFDFRGFDESSYTEPRHIGMALKGLSASGDPMIDPSSGLETKFAFSGDPVAGTGWLDTPQDIRSLLSLKPFTILPGETKSITVVWITVAEPNLEDGLTILKAQAELIQKFPDQYLN